MGPQKEEEEEEAHYIAHPTGPKAEKKIKNKK